MGRPFIFFVLLLFVVGCNADTQRSHTSILRVDDNRGRNKGNKTGDKRSF